MFGNEPGKVVEGVQRVFLQRVNSKPLKGFKQHSIIIKFIFQEDHSSYNVEKWSQSGHFLRWENILIFSHL